MTNSHTTTSFIRLTSGDAIAVDNDATRAQNEESHASDVEVVSGNRTCLSSWWARGCTTHHPAQAVVVGTKNEASKDPWGYSCQERQQGCVDGWPGQEEISGRCVASDAEREKNNVANKAIVENVTARGSKTGNHEISNDNGNMKEPQEACQVWDLVASPMGKSREVKGPVVDCREKVVVAARPTGEQPNKDVRHGLVDCQNNEIECLSEVSSNDASTDDEYDEEIVEDVIDEKIEGKEENEVFDLVRCIPKREQPKTPCDVCGDHPAVVTWASLKNPKELWNYCEQCTETDFEDRVANILAEDEDDYDFCFGQEGGTEEFVLV